MFRGLVSAFSLTINTRALDASCQVYIIDGPRLAIRLPSDDNEKTPILADGG